MVQTVLQRSVPPYRTTITARSTITLLYRVLSVYARQTGTECGSEWLPGVMDCRLQRLLGVWDGADRMLLDCMTCCTDTMLPAQTNLLSASGRGDLKSVKDCIAQGKPPISHHITSHTGCWPVTSSLTHPFRVCSETGAKVNVGDYDHRRALHLAAAEGKQDVSPSHTKPFRSHPMRPRSHHLILFVSRLFYRLLNGCWPMALTLLSLIVGVTPVWMMLSSELARTSSSAYCFICLRVAVQPLSPLISPCV